MSKLKDIIEQKRSELLQSNLYIDVLTSRTEEVGLYKNCVAKNFNSSQGDMEREVEEIESLSKLDDSPSVAKTNNNGVEIVFNVKPKGKRKYIKKEYYVLYK